MGFLNSGLQISIEIFLCSEILSELLRDPNKSWAEVTRILYWGVSRTLGNQLRPNAEILNFKQLVLEFLYEIGAKPGI